VRLLPVLLLGLAVPAAAVPHLVADVNPGIEDFDRYGFLQANNAADGVFYFAIREPAHGRELWRSDGTAEGTYRLTDVCPGRCDSDPSDVTVFHGHLYFSADDGVSGRELWQSDGSPGSEQPVADACPGPCSGWPGAPLLLGDRLFFFALRNEHGQLWATDGSGPAAVVIEDLCPDSKDGCLAGDGVSARGLLFFRGPDGLLWRSDGTPAGTWTLGVESVGVSTGSGGKPVWPLADAVLFWNSQGLWRTDGTVTGTVLVRTSADLGLEESQRPSPAESAVWSGALYLNVDQGVIVRSDGTPEGTARIAHFDRWTLSRLTPFSGGLLVARWLISGSTLLRIQGAAVEEVGTFDSIESLAALGDRAVFRTAGRDGEVLWRTDGTSEGTEKVTLFDGGTYPGSLVSLGGTVLFSLFSSEGASELWRTDGTAAGTARVRGFQRPASSILGEQTALGDAFLFGARQPTGRDFLYVSDGTEAGTRILRPGPRAPAQWASVGRGAVFRESWGESWAKLWWTDGTAQGTRPLRRLSDSPTMASTAASCGRLR
jgi:ELWxxDGT repeat protein